ncbi:MAG: zinc-ribbon domain-containing protein [Patescibacteria group bacterium]|nr:zinc-ribbon domain-containing protein [Patescibacteria group bacterium]MDE2144461.1 zinc-ribbon domain-containing protein [Patescibacteria group bacterium]
MAVVNSNPAQPSKPEAIAPVLKTVSSSEGVCPVCHQPVSPEAYFCPNCGHPLKSKPPEIFERLIVYAVSILLPPFGLGYAWKYLKAGDKASRAIGIMAIVLTTISIIGSIFAWQFWIQPLITNYANQQNQQLNQQLNQFGL